MIGLIPLNARRLYQRYKAPIYCKPIEPSAKHILLVDISLGGMRLHLNQDVKVGDRLEVELLLPDNMRFRCQVQVMWLKSLPNWTQVKYDVGLKFLDIPAEELQYLATLLQIPHFLPNSEKEEDGIIATKNISIADSNATADIHILRPQV